MSQRENSRKQIYFSVRKQTYPNYFPSGETLWEALWIWGLKSRNERKERLVMQDLLGLASR